MKWMPLMGTGLAVRMDLLNEQWAQKNHSQSLDRLAERGGLSCEEALAIAERRLWSAKRQEFESFRALALLSEREMICAAIKAEDDHCADGDYMMDSDDCIKVVRGTWERPDWGGSSVKLSGRPLADGPA